MTRKPLYGLMAIAVTAISGGPALAEVCQDFTLEQAQSQVVSYEPDPLDPDTLRGLDERRRVVWWSGPDGTWGHCYDFASHLIEIVDDHGDRTRYVRDAAGRIVDKLHQRVLAGSWRERTLLDAEGKPVVSLVDTESGAFGDPDAALAVLGIAPGIPPSATTTQSVAEGRGTTTIVASSFARVESWEPNSLGKGVQARETTKVAGIEMTVELAEDPELGLVLRDDWGGWRHEVYEPDGLVLMEDEVGELLRVVRDERGRPVDIYVGDTVMIRYLYNDHTPLWTRKKVIDLRDGAEVFVWDAATPPGAVGAPEHAVSIRPRPVIQARLAGNGVVAEWDSRLYADGVAVMQWRGEPYALVPFDGEGGLLRSYTFFEPEAVWSWDRIDYNDEWIAIHLMTDGMTVDSTPPEVLLEVPRKPEVSGSGAQSKRPPPARNPAARSRESSAGKSGQGLEPSVEPLISIGFCGDGNSCLCISQVDGGNETLDVRCPAAGGGGGGSVPGPGPPPGGGGDRPEGRPIPNAMQEDLDDAKQRAQDRLEEYEECAAMFSDLNRNDGSAVLELTKYRYYPNSAACQAERPAWTRPITPPSLSVLRSDPCRLSAKHLP